MIPAWLLKQGSTNSILNFYFRRPAMDAHMQDQQQKDFLSSLFPMDISLDHLHNPSDSTGNNNMQFMQYNSGVSAQQQPMANSSVIPHTMNSPLSMDLIGNLMSLQVDTQASMQQSPTQAPYNQQMLLEQQMKLAQLQQLQQLQNQIFQQQARQIFTQRTRLSVCFSSHAALADFAGSDRPPQWSSIHKHAGSST